MALYYIAHTLATAAITFGAARRADHRPTTTRYQWAAAVNSFGQRLRFDLLVAALQIGLLALGTGFAFVGGVAWPIPAWAQLIAIFLVFFVLLYTFVALAIVQCLGRVGLTLGHLAVRRAFGVAWNFTQHHFELVGFRILTLLVELMLIAPIVGAIVLMAVYVPRNYQWGVPVTASVLALVAGALIGAGMAGWWHSTYRQLVTRYRLEEAVTLLSGRHIVKARRGAKWLITLVLLILAAGAIAWPWLPLGF